VAPDDHAEGVGVEEAGRLHPAVEVGAGTVLVGRPGVAVLVARVAPQQVAQNALVPDLRKPVHLLEVLWVGQGLPIVLAAGESPPCTAKYLLSTIAQRGRLMKRSMKYSYMPEGYFASPA
jgi:hypothetical protein